MTDVDFGAAHHHLTRTEQRARSLFTLLDGSVVGAPRPTDDLAVWLDQALAHVDMLSGGERVVFAAAMDVYNGTGRCGVADLMRLDRATRAQVVAVLDDYWLGA